MKNFVLEEIKLISNREQRANSFKFSTGLNVVTGQNGVGKSHLIKSIPWAFGAKPTTMHPSWMKADVSVLVLFSIEGTRLKLLRTGDTFLVFDSKNKLVNRSNSVTKELSPFLSKLCRFNLSLPLKSTEELTQLTPAFYLAPFYVDQDSGWVHLWQSFDYLGMFANWRKPLLDNFTGVLSSELQGVKNNLRKERLRLKSLKKQQELFSETFRSVQEEVSNTNFDADFSEYKNEVSSLLEQLRPLQKFEIEYKESIRTLSNKKTVIEEQIALVAAATKSLSKNRKIANEIKETVLECPTCGTEHKNSFAEKFYIAQDLYRAQELLVDLEEDLNSVDIKLEKVRNLEKKTSSDIIDINDILDKTSHKLTIKDVIKKEGDKHIRSFLREKAGELVEKIDGANTAITAMEKEIRSLTADIKNQKERVQDYFISSMRKGLEELNVKNLKLDDYKDMYVGNLPEAGSDKPRAFLAHVFSLIKTIEQFYGECLPPIIIDSPNQQDQDPANIERIYNFITSNKPENHQMLLGLANGEDRDFGVCNKIILKSENYLLDKEKYSEIEPEFSALYSVGLL